MNTKNMKKIALTSLFSLFLSSNAANETAQPQLDGKQTLALALIIKLYGQHKKNLIAYKARLEKRAQKLATIADQLAQPNPDKTQLNVSLEKQVRKIQELQEKIALTKIEVAHCPNALKGDAIQALFEKVGLKFIGTENLPETLEQKVKELVELAQKLLNQINQ